MKTPDFVKTTDFLDAVRVKHKLTSDYQLARFLHWTPQRISIYRAGRRELHDDSCIQIAEALEIPPAYVMACIAGARAKSSAAKRAWKEAAKMLKTGTAAMILGTALFVSGEPSSHAEGASAPSVYSVKRRRNVRRGRIGDTTPKRGRRHRRLPSQKPLFPTAPTATA